MEVVNCGNNIIKVSISFKEASRLVTVLTDYNSIKQDEELYRIIYQFQNPIIKEG